MQPSGRRVWGFDGFDVDDHIHDLRIGVQNVVFYGLGNVVAFSHGEGRIHAYVNIHHYQPANRSGAHGVVVADTGCVVHRPLNGDHHGLGWCVVGQFPGGANQDPHCG
jgi:hypothetical protein